ncbi:hypothetical protein [Bacillus cereus]|uniref:hypothetical protein n=1 Tax=Bacillus cereus TaxID=1396 RepID=UPI00387F16A8
MLKPEETVYRFLISTPSRLVGEYISEDLTINHAWRSELSLDYYNENAFSRSYYMVSFKLENEQEDQVSEVSIDPLLAQLSILFGKRFDNHGPVQHNGYFRVPDLGEQKPIKHYKIGFINHQARANLSVPLSLDHFRIMDPLLAGSKNIIQLFNAAGKFYLRALQTYETTPENAYLDLITCGEMLSNYYSFEDKQMYDDRLLAIFEEIEGEMVNGKAIVKDFKNRLYQIKRRFTFTILKLLTDDFFEASEAQGTQFSIIQDTIQKRIQAAYDLRSKYVHTGIQFGRDISIEFSEVSMERFLLPEDKLDKDLLKILNQAPTFKGLERIIRFCLLQFLQTNGVIDLEKTSQSNETPTE